MLATVLLVGLAACGGQRRVDATALEASSAQFAATIDFDAPDYATLATAMERLTNAERKKQGIAALATNRILRRSSERYAQRMVAEGFLAHEDPTSTDLHTPPQRVAAAGGANPATSENIADVPAFRVESGEPFYVLDAEHYVIAREPDGPPIEAHTYATFAATVVEGWMNSPGHRRNLLNPDALEQGIGAQMYLQNGIPAFVVVQNFQLFEPLK